MAKGGGSANKSFLFQETKALLNPEGLASFLDEKLRSLGTAACPPYHLAVVIGGTSAEHTLRTAKYASARYLDHLPTTGDETGRGFRDLEWEQRILEMTRAFGIGAQFGGKYFCHDVRVVRLPRHGASCPVGVAVSCSADRQIKAKITREGVFLEELERDIKPTGTFRQKARNVQAAMALLIEAHNGAVPETIAELVRLPGVGRKTANVVVSERGKPQGIVVDTHVRRLSQRLGLTRNNDPVAIERDLQRVVPREDWGRLPHLFIWHGRRICDARKPRCEECALTLLCPASHLNT